jgi:outer membrane protein assembly factor BamB
MLSLLCLILGIPAVPARANAMQMPDLPRWSVVVPAPSASPPVAPLLAGDAMVLALHGGGLTARRILDGAALWSTDLKADQELASDETRVYVAGGTAVHALRLDSGTVAWRTELGSALTAPPLAHAGWLIAAAGGHLFAIRAADGRVIWKLASGRIDFRPALDGDLLVVPVTDGTVLALDVVTGEHRWTAKVGSAPLEPLAVGGRVYLGTAGKLLVSLHATSGRRDWSRPVGGILRGRPAVDERHVYYAGMDNAVFALDRGHGAVRWRKGLTYRPASGPVVVGDGVIVPAAAVRALPVLTAVDGAEAGAVTFAAPLAAVPSFLRDPVRQVLLVLAVVGGLQTQFMLTLMEPSLVPALPFAPLTTLPGDVVPLPAPLSL